MVSSAGINSCSFSQTRDLILANKNHGNHGSPWKDITYVIETRFIRLYPLSISRMGCENSFIVTRKREPLLSPEQ